MSIDQTTLRPSARRQRRRPLLFVTAGLIAAALSVGGPLVANAVPTPTIALSATTASPYGQFNVSSGTGFGANATLTFVLDGTDVTNQLVSPVTDASGSFTGSFGWLHFTAVGGGTLGKHTLVVTDSVTHLSASANITVVPDPVPSAATATRTVSQMTKSGVTVSFSGFGPGDTVIVGMYNRDHHFTGAQCATTTADARGVATATCIWSPTYITQYKRGDGSAPGTGEYGLGANNTTFSRYSTEMTVTVGDPVPVTPAAPATPVRGTASFTG